jgi:TldD protein
VKKGLYAANFGGGQVDITSGKFVFSTAEAYLIENGKITTPVKGATLIGNGNDRSIPASAPAALTRASTLTVIGNDMRARVPSPGCRHLRQGRAGQSVTPVSGVGQPTRMRIDGRLKLDGVGDHQAICGKPAAPSRA